jgi:hypothetical protein
VELGNDVAGWTMDVRVDEITGVRFVREPDPLYFLLYVIDPFSGSQRVWVIRAQPSPQVGEHIPELVHGSGMIAPRRHLAGNTKPEDQRDRMILA